MTMDQHCSGAGISLVKHGSRHDGDDKLMAEPQMLLLCSSAAVHDGSLWIQAFYI